MYSNFIIIKEIKMHVSLGSLEVPEHNQALVGHPKTSYGPYIGLRYKNCFLVNCVYIIMCKYFFVLMLQWVLSLLFHCDHYWKISLLLLSNSCYHSSTKTLDIEAQECYHRLYSLRLIGKLIGKASDIPYHTWRKILQNNLYLSRK